MRKIVHKEENYFDLSKSFEQHILKEIKQFLTVCDI